MHTLSTQSHAPSPAVPPYSDPAIVGKPRIGAVETRAFEAELNDGKLLVREDLLADLGRLRIFGAEELLGFVHSFPTAAALGLSWTIDDIRREAKKLCELLRGVVAPEYTDPAMPHRYLVGA